MASITFQLSQMAHVGWIARNKFTRNNFDGPLVTSRSDGYPQILPWGCIPERGVVGATKGAWTFSLAFPRPILRILLTVVSGGAMPWGFDG